MKLTDLNKAAEWRICLFLPIKVNKLLVVEVNSISSAVNFFQNMVEHLKKH